MDKSLLGTKITFTDEHLQAMQETGRLLNEKSANHLQLLNEQQAAAILGWSIKTLQCRRWKSQEPRYRKIGRSVRYSLGDIQEFIESSAVQPVA